jgi:hypothetical protein
MSTVNYNVVSVNNGANLFSAGAIGMASENFAKINATASMTPISEGFQGPDEEPAPTGAIADNPNGITAFTISDASVGTGSSIGGNGNSDGCFMWYFYGIQSGSSKLIFEKLDFTGSTGNQLTFSHAYAQYQAENDVLKISISTDCGGSWTQVWSKSGATLATVPAQQPVFWPTANQWVDNTVDLSAYDNAPDVMIAFEGVSAYGNSLFIDDVNTSTASTTGINNMSSKLYIYPNPAKDILTIEGSYKSVDVFDILGNLVLSSEATKNINVSSLADGVYMLNIKTENGIVAKKITITK